MTKPSNRPTRARKLFYGSEGISFVLACAVTLAAGWTPEEVVWALLTSSMVAGPLALLVPLWVLLARPALE